MPWSETTMLEERRRFVGNALRERFSFAELCAWYGVRRPTGHKWVARYRAKGDAGLHQINHF